MQEDGFWFLQFFSSLPLDILGVEVHAVDAPLQLFQVLVHLQGTYAVATIQVPLDCTEELCLACLPLCTTLWTSAVLWWSMLQKRQR